MIFNILKFELSLWLSLKLYFTVKEQTVLKQPTIRKMFVYLLFTFMFLFTRQNKTKEDMTGQDKRKQNK